MFLDNEGLISDWCVIRDLSRREYGECAISRTSIQRDPKENIKRAYITKRRRKMTGRSVLRAVFPPSIANSDRGCRLVEWQVQCNAVKILPTRTVAIVVTNDQLAGCFFHNGACSNPRVF